MTGFKTDVKCARVNMEASANTCVWNVCTRCAFKDEAAMY